MNQKLGRIVFLGTMLISAVASAQTAQVAEGKATLTTSEYAPPQLIVTGDSAKALYQYLGVSEVADPYYFGGKVLLKSGHRVNCRNFGDGNYSCEFAMDGQGIIP
jgi:hypothetical protein